MASKKSGKSKFVHTDFDDLLNETGPLLKNSPNKKVQKRPRNTANSTDEDAIFNLIGQYQAKKKKLEIDDEACKGSRQKILDVMNHQQQERKERSEALLKNLSEVMSQLEADWHVMKDNEKKLEHLTGAVLKCMQQATTAHKLKVKSLKDIYASFQNQVEEMESNHKAESDKLAGELEDDIKKLQQKLIAETKKSGWETLRKTIFHAMQNDFE